MKVTFDIDHLLEQVREEDVETIICMIDEPDVLDYLAKEYSTDEYMIRKIIFNSCTSKETMEFIASIQMEFSASVETEVSSSWSILMALYKDKRLSNKTKKILYSCLYE